ncbi:XRE family transcriptional regulator [bacterium 1XD42-1]|nr:XRE family transcriptional regulator [bacterium 1XD42-8]RKJ64099.1 XRE family transcriptional regulator [bacterium 1XD42-1]
MELKERISVIIKENHLKQKELAALMGVTESYVSTLLSGRNRNISVSVANLIEEKLGYNAQWLLSGDEPKYKQLSKNPNLSDVHRQVILQLEKMPESEIKAVLAFINSLDDIEKSFSSEKPQNPS